VAIINIQLEVADSSLVAMLSQAFPAVKVQASPKAPYGMKKDGTPKKRPGRPRKGRK